MSLKSFHIAFIAISGLLALFLIYYGLQTLVSEASRGYLLLGTGVGVILVLFPYFFWFRKKMRSLATWVLLSPLLFYSKSSWACSVCFGDPNSLIAKGTKAGVLFLIFVVVAVLLSIFSIGLTWSRRAKLLAQQETLGLH